MAPANELLVLIFFLDYPQHLERGRQRGKRRGCIGTQDHAHEQRLLFLVRKGEKRLMAITLQPCNKVRNVSQSNHCLTNMEQQSKTIVVIQTSLTSQIRPTQI